MALAAVALLSTLASEAAGYAFPLLAPAFVGAVAGAHSPAIAAVYRQLVRRPAPAVKAMQA